MEEPHPLVHAAAIAQVAAGEFADHPGMDEHLARLESCCELRHACVQMIHLDGGLHKDHAALRR